MADILELIATTSDGVFAVDGDQRIILWNQAAEALLGFQADEVLGRFCYEVLGGRDPSGSLVCQKGCRTHAAATQDELPPTHDLVAWKKDGQAIWLNVTTVVVPTTGGDLSMLIYIFRDISRRKEVERFVQQLCSSMRNLPWLQEVGPLPTGPSQELTARELEILQLLASGTSTKGIAERLCISPSTVKNHTQNVLAKLKVHSRLEAVAMAFRSSSSRPPFVPRAGQGWSGSGR